MDTNLIHLFNLWKPIPNNQSHTFLLWKGKGGWRLGNCFLSSFCCFYWKRGKLYFIYYYKLSSLWLAEVSTHLWYRQMTFLDVANQILPCQEKRNHNLHRFLAEFMLKCMSLKDRIDEIFSAVWLTFWMTWHTTSYMSTAVGMTW